MAHSWLAEVAHGRARNSVALFSTALFNGLNQSRGSQARTAATRGICFLTLRTRAFATASAQEGSTTEDRKKQLWKSHIDPRTGEPRKGSNWNYTAELSALAHRLGYAPETLPSLPTALTHRSALPEQTQALSGAHNGRLAVVGHASLLHYTRESLFRSYPNLDGTHLIDLSNFLTNVDALVELAEHLGIPELMRTIHKLYNPTKTILIERGVCAIIGCLYIDQGPEAAKKFVEDVVLAQLKGKDLTELIKLQHPKYMLQTILKESGKPPPVSRLVRESGRATHLPSYVVAVFSGDRCLGEGAGTSLKRAEQAAISAALMKHFLKEVKAASTPGGSQEGFRPERKINFYNGQPESDVKTETAV